MNDRDLKELEEEFEELFNQYHALEDQWSTARADKEEIEDRQKQTLAVLEDNATDARTNVERTRQAYKNQHYNAWINEAKEKRLTFYKLDHKKKGIEKRMDWLRSKMSYIKTLTELGK